MRHILFGDSIGHGVGDYEQGGWATHLRLYIDRQQKIQNHNLINLSISGDDTRLMLARFERELKLRMRDKKPGEFVIIFAVGVNDSRKDKAAPHNEISEEEFAGNLQKLIRLAKPNCAKLAFVGLIPTIDEKTNPYKYELYYSLERGEKYNSILKKICHQEDVLFIDFFPEWKSKLYELTDDGLHPNTKTHQLMFEKIKTALGL